MRFPQSDRLKAALGSIGARLFLGLMAMATVASSIPLADNLQFDIGKAIGVGAAIAAWAGAEWASWNPAPHPHDVRLRNQLFSLVRPELEFLRDHDFGGSFDIDELRSIRKIAATWDGVAFRFRDKKIDKPWAETLQKIKRFSNFVALNSHMIPSSAKIASFKNDEDRRQGQITNATQERINQANQMATQIYSDLEVIEELCLSRIGAQEDKGQG